MPTYEYKCTVCDERFDVVQSIEEDSLTTLKDCAESKDTLHHLKKVFGSVGIAFKGSGFYRNDARGSSKPAQPSASESSSSTTDKTTSSDSSNKTDSSTTTDSAGSASSSDSKSSDSKSSTDSKSPKGDKAKKSSGTSAA